MNVMVIYMYITNSRTFRTSRTSFIHRIYLASNTLPDIVEVEDLDVVLEAEAGVGVEV